MLNNLYNAGNEIVIETFGLDAQYEDGNIDINGQNYKTFKSGNTAWSSEDGSKWVYVGNSTFHFRLKWGNSYVRPELDSIVTLTRKTKKGYMTISGRVEHFVVQERSEIGRQISRSCGVAILRVINYNVDLNI